MTPDWPIWEANLVILSSHLSPLATRLVFATGGSPAVGCSSNHGDGLGFPARHPHLPPARCTAAPARARAPGLRDFPPAAQPLQRVDGRLAC